MIKEVVAKRTLLVNGPASISLVSGKAETLGAPLSVGETIVVRNGKQAALYVEEKAAFDIAHAKDSIVEEVDGDTIPISWKKMVERTLGLEKPTVVMIMGDVDSGKTSLCTFLANKALSLNLSVGVIDADLGQSDVGPPTTVGLAYIHKPVKDLFHVKADDVCFVGFTSPGGAEERVVRCIVDFKNKALRRNSDFLVINTDGWIEGEGAVHYKVMLAEKVVPNMVVGLEQENELTPIFSKLKKTPFLIVEPSTAVRKRDREKRKALRELSYKKYLRNAKVETFPLNWIKIEGIHSSPRLLNTSSIFFSSSKSSFWCGFKTIQTSLTVSSQ
jgi:polynucleotide 5'-hydroxyl-kinase GRC3/NOL9